MEKISCSDKRKTQKYCLQTGMQQYTSYLLMVFAFFSILSCQVNEDPATDQSGQKKSLHPEWSRNAVIYEVNIRQYSADGTFNAFANDLPRLKDLGVDILWIMPFQPIGEKNRKGELGSYYSIKDYKAVNPHFGSMNDFKSLVKKAHDLGFKVIMDWVGNHSAWDNPLTSEHPDWYLRDSLDHLISPYDWTDVVQFDYENEELRNYMINAMKFWVEETNIDGFRCDVAHMVPVSFWEKAHKELDKVKDVFMLAEAEGPEYHHKAFDMSYGWEFHHIMNEVAAGNKDVGHITGYFNKIDTLYPADSYIMQFTSNHDENSWNGTVFERLGDAVEAFAVLSFTVPDMPLIYNGQEVGMDKRLRFFSKDTIHWKKSPFTPFYKTLIELKHDNDALRNGDEGGELNIIDNSTPSRVFSYFREKNADKILVLLNLSDGRVSTSLKGNDFAGDYKNVFTGEAVMVNPSSSFELAPGEYILLQ